MEVEPRGRSLNDDYIFSATGKPEALASFKRKLDNKLNSIRYFELPLPDFVPTDQNLLELLKEVNQRPNTVCFITSRTVKCWILDRETQREIRGKLEGVVEGWREEIEETWVGSEAIARYVKAYLQSETRSPLFDKVCKVFVVQRFTLAGENFSSNSFQKQSFNAILGKIEVQNCKN